MLIRIIAVGKIKEPGVRELIDDYSKRISRYARIEEHSLKDMDNSELVPKFAGLIPPKARTVALEVTGAAWSSHKLADYVGKAELDSVPALAFLIGGSYGLPQETSKNAQVQLSLSAMTLPHRLARLMLFEQIYRAFSILRNEPYSH